MRSISQMNDTNITLPVLRPSLYNRQFARPDVQGGRCGEVRLYSDSLQILGLGFILKTFLKCRKYQPRFSYNKRYQEHWRYVEWLLTHTLSIRCFFVPLSAVH